MEHKTKKVYPSKVGWELIIPILVPLGYYIYSALSNREFTQAAILLGILVFFNLILNSFSYEIYKEKLVITSFFLFKTPIPIESITEIVGTYNPISAPAASLQRLRIRYEGGSVIISPKYRMKFIAHLKELSPSIVVKVKKWKGID